MEVDYLKPIDKIEVQSLLEELINQPLYLHLEVTNGAYAAHRNPSVITVGAFIRNTKVTFNKAKIAGEGPYRVGLKIEDGWVYAEGLTDFEADGYQFLLAGHDHEGKLAVAIQLSKTPFV